MKSKFPGYLAAIILLLLVAVPAHPQTDWWPMFHHDAANTGRSTTTAPRAGSYKWCYPVGVNFLSSPVVSEGYVYAASLMPDVIVCLEAETGEWVWDYFTGAVPVAAPAFVDGAVYIGKYGGDVVCLDALTGSENWTYAASGTSFSSATVVYDSLLLEYVVYIGSDVGELLCLDAASGGYNWSFWTGGPVYSTPAVVDTSVYFGSYDGNVYCLDTTDPSSAVWTFPTGDGVFSSPAATDSAIYVGSFDGSVYCIDPVSGGLIWEYETGDSVWSSPAVAYGMMYVGSRNGNVYCLDAEDPDPPVWVYPAGGEIISSPAVADGVVWVGSIDGGIYCLDAMNGYLIWSNYLDGFVGSSPAIADNVVYVSSLHYIQALGELPQAYDVAITDVVPSRTEICLGDSITVDVTVENLSMPCSDPVALSCVFYYDDLAEPTPEQIETFGWMGDINRDGFIDRADSILLGMAFNSTPGDGTWNPYADLDRSDAIDLQDLMILAMNYNLDIWTYFGLGGPVPVVKHILEMEPWTTEVLSFELHTGDMTPGAHTVSAYVSCVPNESNIWDNDGPVIPIDVVTTFDLTITATQGQTTDPEPGIYPCPCNADTLVEAIPDFWFTHWTLDGDSLTTANPCTLFIDEDYFLHAVFKTASDDESGTPAMAASQNYPNPFNPSTTIALTLPRDLHVTIEIFDTAGRLVKVLMNEPMEAGRHEVVWNGRDGAGRVVASGIYFYRLTAGGFAQTRKMVLLR